MLCCLGLIGHPVYWPLLLEFSSNCPVHHNFFPHHPPPLSTTYLMLFGFACLEFLILFPSVSAHVWMLKVHLQTACSCLFSKTIHRSMLTSLLRWKQTWKYVTTTSQARQSTPAYMIRLGISCGVWREAEKQEYTHTHTQTMSSVHPTLLNLFHFALSVRKLPTVSLTDQTPSVSSERVEFLRPWAQSSNGWEGASKNTAQVITWLCLGWFWFKRGRACQRNSRLSPVSIPRQMEEEEAGDGWKRRQKGEGKKWNKERWRQWFPPRANKMKWTDTEIPMMGALQRETGEGHVGGYYQWMNF